MNRPGERPKLWSVRGVLPSPQFQTGRETLRQAQGKLLTAHPLAFDASFERTGRTQRAADKWDSSRAGEPNRWLAVCKIDKVCMVCIISA